MTGPLLALDTSGPVGSVALSAGGEVRAREFLGDRRGHAAALIPAVEAVLAAAGIARGELAGVVVGSGPGSFTGVRVAAAAAKGLTHALGIPLYPVSSLLAGALTEQALPPGQGPWPVAGPTVGARIHTRYVLVDARGDRLFAAAYRLTEGVPEALRRPAFAHLPEILADEELAGAGFCGDGALRHAERLRQDGRMVLPPPFGFPSADGLLRRMQLEPVPVPAEDPFSWEPEYLRGSNAERGPDR